MKTRYGELCNQLWDKTGTDWNISMSNVLTEPVCYWVSIIPDTVGFPRIENFIGSSCPLESAIFAMEHLLEKIGD
jgi:hypothetical protein